MDKGMGDDRPFPSCLGYKRVYQLTKSAEVIPIKVTKSTQ